MFKRCVITGGIGSGKTTLLDFIRGSSSLWCADEQALDFVRNELDTKGDRLPWTHPEAVSRMVIPRRIALFESAAIASQHCVFDRGIPDSVAFLRIAAKPIPDQLTDACTKYRYDLVFWAPPWREIYRNRAERIQPWEHAEALGFMLRDVYQELGYSVIELPRAAVEERAAFVLSYLT